MTSKNKKTYSGEHIQRRRKELDKELSDQHIQQILNNRQDILHLFHHLRENSVYDPAGDLLAEDRLQELGTLTKQFLEIHSSAEEGQKEAVKELYKKQLELLLSEDEITTEAPPKSLQEPIRQFEQYLSQTEAQIRWYIEDFNSITAAGQVDEMNTRLERFSNKAITLFSNLSHRLDLLFRKKLAHNKNKFKYFIKVPFIKHINGAPTYQEDYLPFPTNLEELDKLQKRIQESAKQEQLYHYQNYGGTYQNIYNHEIFKLKIPQQVKLALINLHTDPSKAFQIILEYAKDHTDPETTAFVGELLLDILTNSRQLQKLEEHAHLLTLNISRSIKSISDFLQNSFPEMFKERPAAPQEENPSPWAQIGETISALNIEKLLTSPPQIPGKKTMNEFHKIAKHVLHNLPIEDWERKKYQAEAIFEQIDTMGSTIDPKVKLRLEAFREVLTLQIKKVDQVIKVGQELANAILSIEGEEDIDPGTFEGFLKILSKGLPIILELGSSIAPGFLVVKSMAAAYKGLKAASRMQKVIHHARLGFAGGLTNTLTSNIVRAIKHGNLETFGNPVRILEELALNTLTGMTVSFNYTPFNPAKTALLHMPISIASGSITIPLKIDLHVKSEIEVQLNSIVDKIMNKYSEAVSLTEEEKQEARKNLKKIAARVIKEKVYGGIEDLPKVALPLIEQHFSYYDEII